MAAFDESTISGLAKEIRLSTESDTHDLAGYSESRVTDLIVNAFSHPLVHCKTMIRFTFIVGGGKLVRSRYDDMLTKWMTAALKSVGYEFDNSAAETYDSQGSFKQQHDTGKNLIYIIVFPHVECAHTDPLGVEKEAAGSSNEEDEYLNESSPSYIVTAANLDIFKDIVRLNLPSWRQLRNCMKKFGEYTTLFSEIEQKMIQGQQLTAREESIYNNNSGEDAEKAEYLQQIIKAKVDEGKLTKDEKKEMLETMKANLDAAKAAGMTKKIEMITARKELLEKSSTVVHRLHYCVDIKEKHKKLMRIARLEDKQKSIQLTIADLTTIGEKAETLEELKQLENECRGWFEDDEDFAARCEYEAEEARAEFMKAAPVKKSHGVAKKSGGGKSLGSARLQGSNIFSNIGKAGAFRSGQSNAKVPAKKKTNSGFASAFGDDSD